MKLLFVHDTKVKEDVNGNYYFGGSFNNRVFHRYLKVSENLTVLTRKESRIYPTGEAQQKFNRVSKDSIKFVTAAFDKATFLNRSLMKSKRIIKNEVINNDYLIARLPSMNGMIAVKNAIRYNKPYLIELVGCPFDSLWNHSILGKFIAPIMYFKTKKYVKNASYVIYVTENYLQSRYPNNNINTFCSNVDLFSVDKNTLMNRLRKIENDDANKRIFIGTIGAVDIRYKGQENIIKALGKLKKDGNTMYEYQLVGGGNTKHLKEIAAKYDVIDQIKFIGQLPHEKVYEWFDCIDIYAQPSLTEGLPRSLVEAMSRAVPSFGSNSGGIPELLENKYIYKNNYLKIRSICNILVNFDKEHLKLQAARNFKESKKYERNIIENRRQAFFNKFIEEQW